jgi:hypothetical protein
MADLSVLLRFLSDSSQAKADSASLRQQVGADLNAITVQSKAGSVETSKAMQSTAVATTQAVAVTTREVNSTGLAFAQTARLASSAGRGIENIFAGNVLAAMRNFSIASRTAFNPNGPLAFASALNSISRETKEAEVLVARFSSVLGSASKNVEGALNKTLFNDFGITAEKALLNPSLAAQKFVSQLALITDAEERAIAVSNVFGASTARVLPTIEAMVAVEQRAAAIASEYEAAETSLAGAEARLSFEQNELTLAQERLTLARQSSFTTSAELVVAEGAVATATAEVAVAETEATAATEALAAAEAELAAVQEEVAVSSGLSLGVIGLLTLAAGALVYGLFKLLDSSKKVVDVTKEQIELAQRRIEVAQQELAILGRLNTTTEDEATRRDALIEVKKRELAIDLGKQKTQESEIVRNLVLALSKEQEAYANVTKEQIPHASQLAILIQTQGEFNVALGDSRENLRDSQKELLEAAKSADIFSAATGRSKEELFAAALAHAKETDAAGQTTNAYTDLAHALGLTTDAEGRLIPATDATTIALRNQIGVLADLAAQAKQTKTDLDNISNARNTYIEGRVANIVAIANGNIERARRLINDALKTDPDFAYQVQQKRGDEAVEKSIDEQLFPRDKKQRSKKVRDDEGRPDIQALDESNRAIIEKMRAANDAIKAEYDKGEKDRDDYYDEARLRLHSATLDELANIESQKIIAATRIKNKKELDHEIAKLDDAATKIKDAEKKEKRRLDAEQNKDENDARLAQLKEKDDILKFYEDKQLRTAEEQQKLGLITDEQIEDLRFEQRQAQMERRLELLNQERAAYGEYAAEYIKLTHDIQMAENEREASEEENQRRMLREQHGKDFGLDKDPTKGPSINDQIADMMGNEPPPVMAKTVDALHELKSVGMDAFKGLAQGFSSMIQTWVQGGDLGPHALRKMTAAVLAAASAQAIVEAIMETARGFAALARYDPISATNHFTAAAIFGGVGLAAAVAGKLISPGNNGSAAGNTFAGGSGGSNGPQYAAFNYNSQTPSASQAFGEGSRSQLGGVLQQIVASNNQVVASNNQVAAHVAALHGKIDSIPGGDLIRANPYAVGDSLQTAVESNHTVGRMIASVGSRGIS